jgi:hypothetical protein
MGRTVTPFSQVVEAARREFQPFRRALRKADQQALDELFEWARLHVQAGVQLASPDPREPILLAMLIELRKEQLRLLTQVGELEAALSEKRARDENQDA